MPESFRTSEVLIAPIDGDSKNKLLVIWLNIHLYQILKLEKTAPKNFILFYLKIDLLELVKAFDISTLAFRSKAPLWTSLYFNHSLTRMCNGVLTFLAKNLLLIKTFLLVLGKFFTTAFFTLNPCYFLIIVVVLTAIIHCINIHPRCRTIVLCNA